MKKFPAIIALLSCCFSLQSQSTGDGKTLEQRLQFIEDKMALKELVDVFSNLADVKDVKSQVLLFTENATVESISDGQPGNVLRGRQQIGDAFGGFLSLFETVYHTNGQQTVSISGDKASGTAYCLVVLIGKEDGKKIRHTWGVRYQDEYVKMNGKWLIDRRVSNFMWRDRQEMGQ